MNKILFLDIETTGFSRQWNDIIEIAAVMCDAVTLEELDCFHEYIKPRGKIPAKIVELTGITDAQVRYCRSESEVLMDFTEWMAMHGPQTVVGHNCKSFDLSFIREKCAYYKLGWNESLFAIVDTYQLCRQLAKLGKFDTARLPDFKQPTIASYFEIEYEAHSAIEDVRALIQIYSHIQKLNTVPDRKTLGF